MDRRQTYKMTLAKGEASKRRVESNIKLQKDKREKSISSKRSRLDEDGIVWRVERIYNVWRIETRMWRIEMCSG